MSHPTRWHMTISDDDKLFFERLGAHIAELRRQQGLTQAQLAEHLGVSQQTANSFEKGRRRVPVSALPAIAKLLKVSIEELLNDEQQTPARRRGPPSRVELHLERVRALPKREQEHVLKVLDDALSGAERRATDNHP
jgi:transcriptional regulator with XRE-family HTH domain